MSDMKIWLVKMPIHKYYEQSANEVKDIARKNGCRIVNARFAKDISDKFLVENPPQLTEKKKGGKKKKSEPVTTEPNSALSSAQ